MKILKDTEVLANCDTSFLLLTEETSDINGIKMAMGKMQIGIRNYLDQLIIE